MGNIFEGVVIKTGGECCPNDEEETDAAYFVEVQLLLIERDG
jgi:hypothetical protein